MASKSLYRIFNQSKDDSSFSSISGSNGSVNSYAEYNLNEDLNIPIVENLPPNVTVLPNDDKALESFLKRPEHIGLTYFEREQKFLGLITDVNNQEKLFHVRLTKCDDNIEREITFSFEEVSKEEINKVSTGRRVIYIIGRQYINGTMYNVSKLYFRKEQYWTQRDIERKRVQALDFYKLMDEEETDG